MNHCINLSSWDDMEGYESSITVKPAQIDIKTYQLNLPNANVVRLGNNTFKQEVADEVAKVVAGAPEDFDTLKEIADYIASDKTSAANINNTLAEHTALLKDKVDKTEVDKELAKKQDRLQYYREYALDERAQLEVYHEEEGGSGSPHIDSIVVGKHASENGDEYCVSIQSHNDDEGVASDMRVAWDKVDIDTPHLNLPNADRINVGGTPLSELLGQGNTTKNTELEARIAALEEYIKQLTTQTTNEGGTNNEQM